MISMEYNLLNRNQFYLYIFLILFSCKTNYDYPVYYGKTSEKHVSLSIEKEIFLISEDMPIAQISSIHISDQYIFVTDNYINNQVYQFDKNGKFIRMLGTKGQGPGEYVFPVTAGVVQNTLYVGSIGTMRLLEFDINNGQFQKSFPIEHGPWPKIVIDKEKKYLYIVHPTRYADYSISQAILNTGKTFNKFSEMDDDFKLVFDIFAPASDIALHENELWQTFNHKYEIKVFDLATKNIKRVYKFDSSEYFPIIKKTKNIKGHDAEKQFRNKSTQLNKLTLLNGNVICVQLRAWNKDGDPKDHLELWQEDGTFLTSFNIPGNERFMSGFDNKLIFVKRTIDKDGSLSHPILIFRSLTEME